MPALYHFFAAVFWAVWNRESFVAEPQWWLTSNNRKYAAAHKTDMAKSACPFFWTAVWWYPISLINMKYEKALGTTIAVLGLASIVAILVIIHALTFESVRPPTAGDIVISFGFLVGMFGCGPLLVFFLFSKSPILGLAALIAGALLISGNLVNMLIGSVAGVLIALTVVFVFTFATRNFCPIVKYKNE